MANAKVLFKSPVGPPRVVRVKIRGTRHIQDKKTGQMKGRKAVKNGETITRRRVKKEFILVKKSKTSRGHIRKARKTYNPGQFF